jgi:hypothetical protein
MTNPNIRIKRSAIPGKRPSNSQMELGELALNTNDGRLFTKKENVGIGTTVTLLNVWTENVGGGAYYTDGNIGIGTTNPVTKVHISDGNGGVSSALYTSDYLTISAQNTAPGFNIIAAGSLNTNRGVFKATRARGTLSSPLVPILNDNTFSLLGAIYDSVTVRATAAINMDVDGEVSDGVAPQRISFWTGTANTRIERMRVSGSGNLGIGTTNPTSKLTVQGDVLVSGVITSTDYNSASDINLKENIQPIENPIDKVLNITGVSFDWKEDGRSSMGVIAQEVERVLPELVSGSDSKTVNYNGLIGLLIEVVKEQQREINTLKEKIK